jgi:hypothetical protein
VFFECCGSGVEARQVVMGLGSHGSSQMPVADKSLLRESSFILPSQDYNPESKILRNKVSWGVAWDQSEFIICSVLSVNTALGAGHFKVKKGSFLA